MKKRKVLTKRLTAVSQSLKAQAEKAIEADRRLTTLMGDKAEPRRQFLKDNALRARNTDV